MGISASQVKELRERTGVGMMKCKKALEKAEGDMEKAIEILREEGSATAAKKAGRTTAEGIVASYIHAGGKIGVLVEVNCETDFAARNEEFVELVKDISMQVAAADPDFIKPEDIDEETLEKEKKILKARAEKEGKPEHVVEKIVEGRLNKYISEICLYNQPFIKDTDVTIEELINSRIASIGENIQVGRFTRYEVGED